MQQLVRLAAAAAHGIYNIIIHLPICTHVFYLAIWYSAVNRPRFRFIEKLYSRAHHLRPLSRPPIGAVQSEFIRFVMCMASVSTARTRMLSLIPGNRLKY